MYLKIRAPAFQHIIVGWGKLGTYSPLIVVPELTRWILRSLVLMAYKFYTIQPWLCGSVGWIVVLYTKRLRVRSLVRVHTAGDL